MACLLAHHNRRTRHCWPHRRDIAAYCGVSERTVNRVMAKLTAWGAIERQQPRAVSSQQFRPAQYTFLFPLPQPEQKSCESEEKNCENQPEPWAKNGGSRGPKMGVAVGHSCDPRNKERRERSKGKDLRERAQSQNPPPRFSQPDFNERDLRKWSNAWREVFKHNAEGRTMCSGMSVREVFETACTMAGVTIERGLELDELRKKWPAPDKIPDWLKETG
jgi:DNA-binding transcriptional MocR family regulator